MTLPAEIYSVDSVRSIDRIAIGDFGIGGYTLMKRAGEAAAHAAMEAFPGARRWQVLCGGGNNGGDGYVVARLAAEQGIAASVLTLVPADSLSGDAATAYRDFAALGGTITDFDGTLDDEADLLVDALLGSGLEREVEGRFAQAVNAMNAHAAPVIALDIPSGLNGDDGSIMGTAVKADLTVTFVGLKTGLFLDSGPELCGRLLFAGLEIPSECRAGQPVCLRRLDETTVTRALPRRARAAHKGDFGHVLVVGGGPGMPGAVRLCGEAALRCGAGLVSVATHPAHASFATAGRPELMCHGIASPEGLAPLLERATAVALGPGLGVDDWSRGLFDAVLAIEKPMVVDADGLNLLAGLDLCREDWILTPHPGEAARMLASTTAAVQADRPGSLSALQRKYGGVVVLKGSGTLVSALGGAPWLCSAGNPGMATAGIGDALTGVIAALLAQGLDAETAAAAGVQIHAMAGDRAAAGGERGMVASDLVQEIRACVNP